MPDRNRDIAEAIADELFTAGNGERADRLVLMRERGHAPGQTAELGGWAHACAVDAIEHVLEGTTAHALNGAPAD